MLACINCMLSQVEGEAGWASQCVWNINVLSLTQHSLATSMIIYNVESVRVSCSKWYITVSIELSLVDLSTHKELLFIGEYLEGAFCLLYNTLLSN